MAFDLPTRIYASGLMRRNEEPRAIRSSLALLIELASGLRQSRFQRGKEARCFASGYDTVIES